MDERDVEAAARRIVDGVKPGGEVDGYSPTTDQWWVIDRYRELRRTTHQSFLECAIQARVEFVARVLAELELPERRPAAMRCKATFRIDGVSSSVEFDSLKTSEVEFNGKSFIMTSRNPSSITITVCDPARPGAGEGDGG